MDPIESSLGRALHIQARTIKGLVLRDLVLRYGRDNIGFAWVVLEPMLLTMGVMVIWSLTGTGKKEGMTVIEVVFTGYLPLTLWRHMTGGGVFLFRRSYSLLYHRSVTLFDLVVSRQILEFIGTSTALLVIWGGLNLFGLVQIPREIDLFLLGWWMMGSIALATSACFAVATELSESAERFVQPFQYLNIPISGAFFLVDWLPTWAQSAIAYHPLVHCYEVFRSGYFGATIVAHYDLIYFCACTVVVAFAAVIATRRVRDRLLLA